MPRASLQVKAWATGLDVAEHRARMWATGLVMRSTRHGSITRCAERASVGQGECRRRGMMVMPTE